MNSRQQPVQPLRMSKLEINFQTTSFLASEVEKVASLGAVKKAVAQHVRCW